MLPEEIAVSILAQIVQLSRSQAIKQEKPAKHHEAKDPVCGMTVNVGAAKHKSEHDGKAFYFCCAGCKQKFDKQPDLFAPAGIPA
jgi:YHS domain-containing protein